MSRAPTPDAYLIAHLREALATDPRVAELGIEVTVAAGTIVLTGRVGSDELRTAADDVARAHAEGLAVLNDLEVVDLEATPAPPERLS